MNNLNFNFPPSLTDQFPILITFKLFLGGVTLILQLSFIINNQRFHIWFCNTKVYFIFASIICSIWFIISMTFDRFYSIIQPHKAASFNTVKRAKVTIFSIFVFGTIFSIPHWLLTSHQEWHCLPFRDIGNMDKVHSKVYYWIYFVLSFALPFVLLLIMNSVIIHTLNTRMGKTLSKSEGQGQKEMKGPKKKYEDKQFYIILLFGDICFPYIEYSWVYFLHSQFTRWFYTITQKVC